MPKSPVYKLAYLRHGKFLVVSVDIFIPELPDDFANYRIVQLTDFHAGKLTKLRHIEHAFKIAASYRPDFLALTGDFVDLGNDFRHPPLSARLARSMVPMLHERRVVRSTVRSLVPFFSLLAATDGIFGVLGNHDYLEGALTIVRNLSGHLVWLINQSISIKRGAHSIQIAGVDDVRYGKPNIVDAFGVPQVGSDVLAEESLRGLTHSVNRPAIAPFFRVLLSHSPDITTVAVPDEALRPDLIIAGHTHGGQIRIPLIGALVTHTKQHQHVCGLSYWGKCAVYVSRGIGYGLFPLRVNCPPEVTVFTFRRA